MRKTVATGHTSFHDRLIADANERHSRRLAEIKTATPKLQMFEPMAAALAERGINVANNEARVDYEGTLIISKGGMTEWNNSLHAAMLDLGFIEIERRLSGMYAHCLLKKGRLKVLLFIKPAPEAKGVA